MKENENDKNALARYLKRVKTYPGSDHLTLGYIARKMQKSVPTLRKKLNEPSLTPHEFLMLELILENRKTKEQLMRMSLNEVDKITLQPVFDEHDKIIRVEKFYNRKDGWRNTLKDGTLVTESFLYFDNTMEDVVKLVDKSVATRIVFCCKETDGSITYPEYRMKELRVLFPIKHRKPKDKKDGTN